MTIKLRLLTATTLVAVSSVANAQTPAVTLPTAELRGAGATAIGPATAILMNCVGNPGNTIAVTELGGRGGPVVTGAPAFANSTYWYYGTNSNQALYQVPGLYLPVTPAVTNPQLDCANNPTQPNFQGKYIGVGSGGGRNWWARFSNQLPGTGSSNINPFARVNNGATNGTQWSNLQFAFSEGPISASDLTTYNAQANNTANGAGAPIQFPLYVVPLALAYPQRYGILTVGTAAPVSLSFNVKVPVKSGTTVIGGLRMNREVFCRIFNGVITNWNDPRIQALNANTSLRSAADDSSRWANEGVPIRLVGRLDSSGTSNIYIRHMAAVCPAVATAGGFTNKFQGDRPEADSLPFDTASTIDLRPSLGGTRYFTGNTSTSLSSSTLQSLSGAVYERTTDSIVGTEATGLFMVADGNSGVEAAIASETPANLVVSASNPDLLLNGKFGYVSGDWIVPAPNRTLFSVALPAGASTTSYVGATVANSAKAFGTILPPQTTAASGAYNAIVGVGGETRTSPLGGTVQRARPQDWANVLYPTGVTGLAIPASGYPITGVSFALLYTCYNSVPKRLAVTNAFSTAFGKQTKVAVARPIAPGSTVTSVSLSPNSLKGTAPTSPGIITQFGLGIVPPAWQNAITETFLKRSAQSSNGLFLRDLNLWIQSALPTNANQINGTAGPGDPADLLSNPTCDPTKGA